MIRQVRSICGLVARQSRGRAALVWILAYWAGAGTWAVLRAAIAEGIAVRVGLEDVAELPDGTPVTSNGPLVATAVAWT